MKKINRKFETNGYTAIYDTSYMKGVEYYFEAESLEDAISFCRYKFSAREITLRNEKTGETMEIINSGV